MRVPCLLVSLLVIGVSVALALPGVRAQVPQIPASFYGSATIDGQRPPANTPVRGFIDGIDCTQPGAAGTIDAGNVGAYIINVMHESQKPGCGREGTTVRFRIGGREAGQTAPWEIGPHALDLNAGLGQPQPLPSEVPIPTSRPVTTPGVLATDDAQNPGTVTGTRTPVAPGVATVGDEDDGGAGGLGLAALVVIALLAVAVTGGAAAWAVRR